MSTLNTAPLSIALVQSEQYWHDPEKNRAHFGSLIEDLTDLDLIVLPEMFSTGFTMDSKRMAETMEGPTMDWLRSFATNLGSHICGSMIIEDNGFYYNRFFLIGPDAEPLIYDKRHLFRMADEHNHYRSGSERLVFELKGIRMCPQVCYDLRFPVFSRNQNDYDLLLYVANWPAARRSHWRTLLTARAIENQTFVVGVNRIGEDGNQILYAGDSGIIDANGEWLVDLKSDNGVTKVQIDLTEQQEYRQRFPAWRDADDFTLDER